MVGYLLELLHDGSLLGATMQIRRLSLLQFQQVLPPILG
jgi:hypothetical protein